MDNPVPNLPQEAPQAPAQVPGVTVSTQPIVVVPSGSRLPRPRILIIFLIIVGLLGVAVAGYFFFRPSQKSGVEQTPPTPSSTELFSPAEIETMSLNDVSGGTSSGLATRGISSLRILHTVSATLPELAEGQFYQVWLYRSPEDFFPIGDLIKDEQGNYKIETLFEFNSENPPPASFEHNTVVVSLKTTNDLLMETRVLEGTFGQ